MSETYINFSEHSDISIRLEDNTYRCLGCKLVDKATRWAPEWRTENPKELLAHVEAHKARNHQVPNPLVTRIKKELNTNVKTTGRIPKPA
jgi:hypothetical protein